MPLSFYLHGDALHEYQRGRELLGAVAERLPLFRAVNTVQPNTLALAIVQHSDGVAIGHAHHAAGEVGGEALAGKQGEADEQRQGGNRLGTAHGISRTARTAPILLEAGRKGDSGTWASAQRGVRKQEPLHGDVLGKVNGHIIPSQGR